MTAMLERLTILNLETFMKNFFLDHLFFPHFNLFLPSGLAVKLFIIFTKIKTTIVKTFIEILYCYFFTIFLKLCSASSKFN